MHEFQHPPSRHPPNRGYTCMCTPPACDSQAPAEALPEVIRTKLAGDHGGGILSSRLEDRTARDRISLRLRNRRSSANALRIFRPRGHDESRGQADVRIGEMGLSNLPA